MASKLLLLLRLTSPPHLWDMLHCENRVQNKESNIGVLDCDKEYISSIHSATALKRKADAIHTPTY